MQQDSETHFGFETVKASEKAERVAAVFHSVARRYDLMNDLMSFGIHRLWKQKAIALLNVQPHHRVLDLAGGTGDLSYAIYQKCHSKQGDNTGQIFLTDINPSMIECGKKRLEDKGIFSGIDYVIGNAECLPYPSHFFHRAIIGFGLRNVTNKEKALQELHRVLKLGGKLIILEFSQPTSLALRKLYDTYSFELLPKIGQVIANDEASYRYLAESIRMHPPQETLKNMLLDAGFKEAGFENVTGGIVAIHWGLKC